MGNTEHSAVRLFLSYAREDFEVVSALYDRLEALGLRPWMDKRDLLPGQRWRDVIAREVKQCELVLVCLSPQSVDKRGFYQREIRAALDAWQEKRQDDIYLIPVRLAVCDVPQELEEFNWVDLHDTDGWKLLLRAIEAAAKGLGRPVPIELAEALASKKKQPVHSPAEAPAGDPAGAGNRSRLEPKMAAFSMLRDVLAELYPSSADAERVASDAGVSIGRVSFAGSAITVWHGLLREALKEDLAPAIVEVARREYPRNKALADAAAAFLAETERSGPASQRTDAAAPSSQVGKGEAQHRLAILVEQPARPAKPVEAARSDLLIIDKPLQLELVRVPAGEFLMGSDPVKDSRAYVYEKPQHWLSLAEFYIGKYPVTNEQYAVFVGQTQGEASSHWQGGKIPSGKEKHPVVNVSWHDARAFCAWVSEASGGEIRLPSEAEWEKAARGVDGRLYPWGNEVPNAELCNRNGSKIQDTTPVDRYPKGASPYGALDMAGNVWDWTGSLWGNDSEKPQFGYPYKPTDGREDLQAKVDIMRVLRGGSYGNIDRNVRCAARYYCNPDDRYSALGFRLVCVSPPS